MRSRSVARPVVLVVVVILAVMTSISCSRGPQIPLLDVETVIVWAPHPDDEAFGVAQTAKAHQLAGIRVVAVLLTDGESSGQVPRWVEDGRGEDLNGDGTIDQWDFALARRDEFTRAAAAIGADEVLYLGAAESMGAEGLRDRELDAVELEQIVRDIAAEFGPDIGHLAPVGQIADDPYLGDLMGHPDHEALFAAVSSVVRDEGHPAYFYKVYEYFIPAEERQAPLVVVGDEVTIAAKLAALDGYSGIAKVGSPELWEGSATDPQEYLVPPAELW